MFICNSTIMRTKLRLFANVAIQILLLVALFVQLNGDWKNILLSITFFALGISVWQIFYAFYMVQKHEDWYWQRYLTYMQRVLQIAAIVLILGLFSWAVTLGYFTAPIFGVLQYLAMALGITLSVFVLTYLVKSITAIYEYFAKPKSFWDL